MPPHFAYSLLFHEAAAIQRSQIGGKKFAIFADQFSVEVNLAAAVIGSLDANHIPMNLAAVPVVGLFIRLTRREMERARNLFIEENVPHRMEHEGIESE